MAYGGRLPANTEKDMTISDFFRKIFSGYLIGNCLGIVVAAGLLFVGALYFIKCYTHHDLSVTVPNLRGQMLDVAQQKLEALGLRAEVKDTGYVDTYLGDVVLEQSLRPGEKVKPGRLLQLTINSATAKAIALPNVADNCSRREAEARLRGLGFRNIRTEFTKGYKDWVTDIKVDGLSVLPGTRIPVTTLVTLVVGDGSLEDRYNGNDSLDYEIFGDGNDIDIMEDGGGEPFQLSHSTETDF